MTRTVELQSVAEINPRVDAGIADDDNVSFLAMQDVSESGTTTAGVDRPFREVKRGYTSFRSGDVLFAKITPCFENGKIGQALTNRSHAFGSTEFHVVRPIDGVLDPRYIHHFLRLPQVRSMGELRMTGSAGQRRVPSEFVATLRVPLSVLEEQRWIAAILDQVGSLCRSAQESLQALHDLVGAQFVRMFGNDHGYPIVAVRDVALPERGSIRTEPFGSQLLTSEFTEDGVAVLGIDNVVSNEFRWAERRYISVQKYQRLKRYTVQPGDVLITIMGTCGRCAIVPEGIVRAINTKHLCCITLDHSKMLPEFLHSYFLRHPQARRYLEQKAKGAIMSGLNMGIIQGMPVPLVPLERQKEWADFVGEVESTSNRMQQALKEVAAIFASLQHRAFRGEL